MKARKVPALRSKRGLLPGEREAEPQVVGLAPQTTGKRRTDTMKTNKLREPKTDEPQSPPQKSLRHDPSATRPTKAVPGRAGATASGPVLFVGLDVHKDSIAVSLAPSDSTEVRRYG